MGKKRLRKNTEICSSNLREPQGKRRPGNTERHALREPTKRQKRKNRSIQPTSDELTIQVQEMNSSSTSMCLMHNDEAWMMQTSSAYDYDSMYEHTECWDTYEENLGENKKVTKETTVQCDMNKDENKRLDTKKETRERKIKSLKALLRKQDKTIDRLKSDAHRTTHTQSSVAPSKNKRSRTNQAFVTKGCSRQRLGDRGRRSRKKLEPCNSVASARDVDIWMSRGELITKDEFLAVVGLVRVAKFH